MASRPSRALAIAAFAFAFAALLPTLGHAYERQWHVGGAAGYSALLRNAATPGFGGGLHLDYGLTDMFNLMAKVDYAAFPDAKTAVWSGALGVGYVFDVFEWVPYVGALAGVAQTTSSDSRCDTEAVVIRCQAFKLNLVATGGLDYMVTRRFAVGAAGRYQILLLGAQTFNVLGAYLKAEYVFGN